MFASEMLSAKMTWEGQGVYFILAEKLKLVKIGRSSNVARRLQDLAQFCPDTLIPLIVVTPEDNKVMKLRGKIVLPEFSFHLRYADYRHHGEWFLLKGKLKTFIAGRLFTHTFYEGDAEVEYREKMRKIFKIWDGVCKK